jgi:hypothetical protein
LFSAGESSLSMASSLGNKPRFLVTLHSDMSNDSIVLVVYITLLISGG